MELVVSKLTRKSYLKYVRNLLKSRRKIQKVQWKFGKELSRRFMKMEPPKTNKYLKRCTNSLVIREMHFKSTSCLLAWRKQKPDNQRYWCRFCRPGQNPSCMASGRINCAQIKHTHTPDPEIPLFYSHFYGLGFYLFLAHKYLIHLGFILL